MCKIPKWTIICLYLLTFMSLCASTSSTGERNGRYKRTLLDLFPSLKTKRLTKDMLSLLNERHSRPKRANPDFENLLYSLYLPPDDRGRSKRKFRKYNLFTLSGLHDSDVLENELSVDSSTTPIPIEALMQMNVPELQNYIFDGDNVKYKEHYLGDDVLLKQMTPQNIAIRAGSSTANLTTTTELEDACTDLVTEALQTTSTAPTTVTKTTPVLVTEASHLSSSSSTLTTVQTPSTASTLSTQKTSTTSTLITDAQTSADLTLTTNTTRDLSTEVINISSALTSVTDTTRVSTTERIQTTSSTPTSVADTTQPSTTESSQTTSGTLTSVTDTTRVSTTESSQTTSRILTSVTDTTLVSAAESSQTTSSTLTSVADTTRVSTTENSQTTTATHTSVTDTTRASTTESSQTTTATHTSVTDTTRASTTESPQTTSTTHTSVTDTTRASTTESSQTTSTTPTSTTDTTRATTTETSQTTSTTRAPVTDSTQDVSSTNSIETNVQQISTTTSTSTESITSIETTNEIPTLNTAEYLNLLANYGPENQKTFGNDFFNTLPFIYYRTSFEGLEKGISLPSFGTFGYSSVGITEANNINNNECQKYKSFFAQKTYKRFVEEVARRVAEQMTAKRNSDASVMEKILGEIEGIKNLASTNKDQKPGMFCDLNGSWTSASGGMRIDITKATDGSVKASLAERTPKKRLVEGFLGDASWKITATMPFKNSGLIILNAVHEEDRHAATFIGECKYCDNSEIVTGHWLLGRTSRDCKDQKAAHRLIGDVWRRENLNILRKQRLAELLTKPKRSG